MRSGSTASAASEVRGLLDHLERGDVSPRLRADLRQLRLLTRRLEGRSTDEAIDHLRRRAPVRRDAATPPHRDLPER